MPISLSLIFCYIIQHSNIFKDGLSVRILFGVTVYHYFFTLPFFLFFLFFLSQTFLSQIHLLNPPLSLLATAPECCPIPVGPAFSSAQTSVIGPSCPAAHAPVPRASHPSLSQLTQLPRQRKDGQVPQPRGDDLQGLLF